MTNESPSAGNETRGVDPICGMTIDPDEAAGSSEYEGGTVFFCSTACKEEFDAASESHRTPVASCCSSGTRSCH